MDPLITVITAVYNDEKYIKKSVESILNQTFRYFEYIIVDDGSSDNTLKILKEIALVDSRVKILNQKNSGAAAARNLAIYSAKTNYIAIQDSDDISSPDRLKIQLDHLIKSDGNLISCTGYNVIDKDDNLITSNNKVYTNINKNILKGSFCACHPSMMFSKELVIKIGGYNTFYSKTEDYDLIFWLIENGAFIQKINQCLYNYRVRENSEGSMNNGAYSKRVYENHLNRIKNRQEDFTVVINEYKQDKNYMIRREAHEVFFSENYSDYKKLYGKLFYKLPFKYFIFYGYALFPQPLKRAIKTFF